MTGREGRRVEALRLTPERVRLALDVAQLAAWEYDLATGENRWDERLPQLLGIGADEAEDAARRWVECIHPGDRARVLALLDGVLAGESDGYDVDFRVIRRDGTTRWWTSRGKLVGEGAERRLIGVVQDVTERHEVHEKLRASEERLRESEARVRIATEAAEVGIYEHDLETCVLTWDARLRALFGVGDDEPVTNELFLARVHPDDHRALARALERARDPASDGRFSVEYRVVDPEHRGTRWIAATGQFFFRDGRAVRVVGSAADVSAQRGSQELLASTLDAITIGVVTTDRHGHVLGMNAAARRLHALDAGCDARPPLDELLSGCTLAEPDGTPLPHDRSPTTLAMRGEYVTERELRMRTPDGVERLIAFSVRPLAGGRLVLVMQDVGERRAAEERVRTTEALLSAVLDALPVGVGIAGNDGRVLRMNAANHGIWGGPPMSESIDDYVHWRGVWAESGAPIAPDEWPLARAVSEGRTTRRARVVIDRFDGRGLRDLELSAAPVVDPTGRRLGGVVVCDDVTDRVAAERAVREREALLSAVLEALPVGVVIVGPTGGLTHDNAAHRALWGAVPETTSLAQYGAWVGYRPDGTRIAPHEWALARALDRGDLVQNELVECERFETGERRWFLNNTALVRDPHGRVVAAVAVELDVTERLRAEAALRASEQRAKHVLESVSDAFFALDRNYRFTYANPQSARLLGRTSGELLGKRVWDEYPDLRGSVFEAAYHRAMQDRIATEVTAYYSEDDRHYEARVFPSDEGISVYFRDVTERVRQEIALREQDQRKDEFLATLAHELRNPLAPIRTGVTVLRMSESVVAGTPAARALDMMDRQLAHLVHLVDDLLDVSRVSRGRITLRNEPVALQEIVEAAVEACRPTIDARRHALVIEMPERSLIVDADRTRLLQAVANLLTNAAKYTEPGGRITVRARAEDDTYAVSVTDTGIGIPSASLPHVWEMFTQVRDTVDRAQGGLGIGLAIVKKLIELHGGRVEATSEGVGRGSTFTIHLPARAAEPRPGAASVEGGPRRDARTLRVLVVDDNVDGAESLAMMLQLGGHEVRTAHDGPAALDVARAFRPDLVVCDIGLPGMDGYAVARRMRAEHALASSMLVALTGWGSDDDRRRSHEAGFDHHLTKPVAPDTLGRIVSAMAERQARAERGARSHGRSAIDEP